MHRDSERHKLFGRRTAFLAGAKLLLLTGLGGRLAYLQIVESERYRLLAEENRINFRLLPPPRGRIVDRFGRALASNRQNYRALFVSEDADNVDRSLDMLGNIIPLSEAEKKRILREVRRKRSFVPVTVRENLDWQDVARIEVNAPDLPGVMIDIGQTRFYPHGALSAHVLGYVAAVSEGEVGGDPLLELPGFRIGKAGLEKVHDLSLRGAAGNSQVEVNAVGRIIRELERNEGEPGAEVSLTIDLDLQKMISNRLGDESAAVVVMDIHRGDVLALASNPSFDPNAFNRGLRSDEWSSLANNPRAPLINKAISGQYSPGSTFKMCVLLAALERGMITPDTKHFCNGHVELGNRRFHCWKRQGHGLMDMAQSLVQSCDIYYYEVAKRLGIDRIAAMARKLGLGSQLGIDLPGEKRGLVPTREWKQKAIGTSWQKGETLIAGIGQGYILTTPLQLAVMTARIANGGVAVTPRLTRSVTDPALSKADSTPAFPSLGINRNHLEMVRNAMGDVVNDITGTAFRSRIREDGMAMAGKTGTVQVRRISKAEREVGVIKNDELPWEQRDHAIFVGFAPVDNPVYACAVVVEHGGSGSKAAAPIAGDVLLAAQRLNSVRPGVSPLVNAQAPDHDDSVEGEG